MPYSTGSTEVGVHTVKWSLNPNSKGVQPKVYMPGSTYWFVPFINDWHTFETREQKIEMSALVGVGDRSGRDDLLFKSIDGNDISLDIVITYQIIQEMAATVLQEVAISDLELKENVIRTVTRSKTRDLFGELSTEDFYDAKKRDKKSEEVEVALNEILKPYGVNVRRVELKDYRFNPEYEQAIANKKIADQNAERLKSETLAVTEEYLTLVERAKAEVEKVMAQADGEYMAAVIQADAYYEQQKKLAEAVLAEGRAAAEGVRKMNEALSGEGGMAMVKLEVAKALKDKRIVMFPMGGGGLDVRNTDVNSLLQLFGVQKLTEQK
jgi:regulator of protease activity HflC (stomatin/prohibitin superfamily)